MLEEPLRPLKEQSTASIQVATARLDQGEIVKRQRGRREVCKTELSLAFHVTNPY